MSSTNVGLIILIIVLALGLIAGIVLLIVFSSKRKKAAAQNEPVYVNAPVPANAPVAAPSFMWTLSALTGPLAGQVYELLGDAVIGRSPERCHIVLPVDTPGVSSEHCRVSLGQDAVILTDLGSTYGTFIADGMKLEPNVPVSLSSGARFCLAAPEVEFSVQKTLRDGGY